MATGNLIGLGNTSCWLCISGVDTLAESKYDNTISHLHYWNNCPNTDFVKVHIVVETFIRWNKVMLQRAQCGC